MSLLNILLHLTKYVGHCGSPSKCWIMWSSCAGVFHRPTGLTTHTYLLNYRLFIIPIVLECSISPILCILWDVSV